MQTIVTPELTLEPLNTSHAEAMFELLADEAIYRHLDYSAPESVEYLRGVYARLEGRTSPDGSESWLNWLIRPRDLPLVGYVQATVASNRTAHVAYVLASRYWGHGYAQRAMQAMLEHLVAVYDVDRCLATVEVGNQRSVRLLERLNFSPATGLDLKRHHVSTTERMFVRSLVPVENTMPTIESLESELKPLLPGLLGIRLTEANKDRVVATMMVRPDLCTTGAALHGGAIMAFADSLGAVGTFLNLPHGARTTTVDSTTKFIGKAPQGSTVVGECIPFHRGRTTMVWQTLIKSESGKLCAVVTQTQLTLRASEDAR